MDESSFEISSLENHSVSSDPKEAIKLPEGEQELLTKGFSSEESGKTLSESRLPNNEREVFENMSETIYSLANMIRRKDNNENKEAATMLLGDLLKARERYYYAIAQALNPNIEAIDEEHSLYKVSGTEVYGSLTAILDAQESTENHRTIVETLALPRIENIDTIQAEKIQPHKLESRMTLSGSSSQERVQKHWADLDLVEHVSITASDQENAAQIIANAMQSHFRQLMDTKNTDSGYTIYPTKVFAGMSIYNGKRQNKVHVWKPDQIIQGQKQVYKDDGSSDIIQWTDMCNDPRKMYIEYVCVTDSGDAFPISKIVNFQSQTPEGVKLGRTPKQGQYAFQEVYFESPERYDLTAKTLDPIIFISYLERMSQEVSEYTFSSNKNELKRMKRLYNFCKVQGDFSSIERIEKIFEHPACKVYQQIEHLDAAQKIASRHEKVNPEFVKTMRNDTISLLESIDHPQTEDAIRLLQTEPDTKSNKEIKRILKNIVNDVINYQISEDALLQNKIVSVIRLTGGNNGYQ